jgi:hypothetical protein
MVLSYFNRLSFNLHTHIPNFNEIRLLIPAITYFEVWEHSRSPHYVCVCVCVFFFVLFLDRTREN